MSVVSGVHTFLLSPSFTVDFACLQYDLQPASNMPVAHLVLFARMLQWQI